MADDPMPNAPAPAAPAPQSARWHVAWMFPLIWIVCWLSKTHLLGWLVISPLLGLGLKMLSFSEPADVFMAYLELTTSVALLVVLPLLARLALRRRRMRTGFLGISYAVVLLSLGSVYFVLAPMFMRWLVLPASSLAPVTLSLNGLTSFLAKLYLAQAVAAQVAVVSAMRVHPARARSLRWAIVRWLVVGLAAFLLAAMLTPPDATSHWLVLLTWGLFWGIAKLATHFVGTGSAPRANEPVAPPEAHSTSSPAYKPPAAG